jgi:hypothetical protein
VLDTRLKGLTMTEAPLEPESEEQLADPDEDDTIEEPMPPATGEAQEVST